MRAYRRKKAFPIGCCLLYIALILTMSCSCEGEVPREERCPSGSEPCVDGSVNSSEVTQNPPPATKLKCFKRQEQNYAHAADSYVNLGFVSNSLNLISVGILGRLHVWNLLTKSIITSLNLKKKWGKKTAFSSDLPFFAVASSPHEVIMYRLWREKISEASKHQTFSANISALSLVSNQRGGFLAVSTKNNLITLLQFKLTQSTPIAVQVITRVEKKVSLAFHHIELSSDGQFLIGQTSTGQIKTWKIKNSQRIISIESWKLPSWTLPIRSFALSSQNILAVVFPTVTIFFSLEDQKELLTLREGGVSAIFTTKSQSFVLLGQSITLWSILDGKKFGLSKKSKTSAKTRSVGGTRPVFHKSGELYFLAGNKGILSWSLQQGEQPRAFSGGGHITASCPTASWGVVSQALGQVIFFAKDTGEILYRWNPYGETILAMACTNFGQLLSLLTTHRASVWDVSTSNNVINIKQYKEILFDGGVVSQNPSIQFSPDNQQVIFAFNRHRTLQTWSLKTSQIKLLQLPVDFGSFALHPKGWTIAIFAHVFSPQLSLFYIHWASFPPTLQQIDSLSLGREKRNLYFFSQANKFIFDTERSVELWEFSNEGMKRVSTSALQTQYHLLRSVLHPNQKELVSLTLTTDKKRPFFRFLHSTIHENQLSSLQEIGGEETATSDFLGFFFDNKRHITLLTSSQIKIWKCDKDNGN